MKGVIERDWDEWKRDLGRDGPGKMCDQLDWTDEWVKVNADVGEI